MAQYMPLNDASPLIMQLKSLNDTELLDFWEETQQLDTIMQGVFDRETVFAPDYERLILMELQLRSCQRGRASA